MTTAVNTTPDELEDDAPTLETTAGTERRTIRHPADADIRRAIAAVWAHTVRAVVLDGPAGHGFLQTADGRYIQCLVTPQGPLYAAAAATPERAQALFLSFAHGDDAWRTAVDWQVDGPDVGPPPESRRSKHEVPWGRAWATARAEYRLPACAGAGGDAR